MDAPNLPGFYFDKEKRKYFKIQPDHRLPPNAKHAYGNIVKEQRAEKRQSPAPIERRKEKQRKKRRKKQTWRKLKMVKRSAVISSTNAASTTLRREMGITSRSGIILDASAVLAARSAMSSQATERKRGLEYSPVLTAIPKPDLGRLFVVENGFMRSFEWNNLCSQDEHVHALSAQDVSIRRSPWQDGNAAVTLWPARAPTELLEGNYNSQRFDCRVTPLENLDTWTQYGAVRNRILFNLDRSIGKGTRHATVRISRRSDHMAVAMERHVLVFNSLTNAKALFSPTEDNARSVDFMSETVIAADDCNSVKLWDIRLSDSNGFSRFRNDRQITGFKALNEHQLLVADNYSLKVFDTRFAAAKAAQPAVCFDIRQELSHAKMDVNEQGIVAIYGEQCVSLLSLKQGTHLRSFELRGSQRGSVITDLSWWDDANGVPYVQACVGNQIHRISPAMAPASRPSDSFVLRSRSDD